MIEQNTQEWLIQRGGKFTASMFHELFAKDTTQTYKNAIYKVAFERLTGELVESEFQGNYWTERGHELEPLAIEEYEKLNNVFVDKTGFIQLNDWIGCSPDGLIGDNGVIEVKSPKYSTFMEYLLKEDYLPTNYKWQVYGELLVTGREWVDFVVYYPKMKLYVKRYYRDENILKELENQLNSSIEEVQNVMEKLKKHL